MKFYNGDCLENLFDIADNSIDLILADPPYGTTDCKWDSIIPLEPLWIELKRIIKKTAATIFFTSQPFTTEVINSNRSMFRYEFIWLKQRGSNFLLAKKMPLKAHENIIVFYEKLPGYNPQMVPAIKGKERRTKDYNNHKSNVFQIKKKTGEDYDSAMRYPISYFFCEQKTNSKFHPSEKPVALLEYLIKTYTQRGDTVLDFCMGSGSTGVACKRLYREFIGIEKDKKYYELAINRIKNTKKGFGINSELSVAVKNKIANKRKGFGVE